MTVTSGQVAQITARCGVARCGTARCGCAPNDVEDTDDGVLGAIVTSEPTSLFSTSTGTVVDWGLAGAGGGVDELEGGSL